MKKKWITVIGVIVALVLLFPVPIRLKDGGTVQYTAILYKISDVRTMATVEDYENGKEFYEGIVVEIFGFEVYNNVK